MFRDEEILEGKKDAGVDIKNKLPMRKLSGYSDAYREGYRSIYIEDTKADMDEKTEEEIEKIEKKTEEIK